jgi:peptidoglycan/LPS O-acetylase OafA/YrhL
LKALRTAHSQSWIAERWVQPVEPLRGIAAFAVVVHHSWRQAFTPPIFPLAFWLGDWGVALFFVISGFCIHLPQAARERDVITAPIDWGRFFARRARRILPAYYAALMLSALVCCFTPIGNSGRPSAADLIAHALMIPVWYFPFFHSINMVFWTIAIECQFYLAYPFYLHMRRRFGASLPLLLTAVGMAIFLSSSVFPKGGGWRFVWQRLFVVYWWQWSLGAYLADWYVGGIRTWWTGLISFSGSSLMWLGASLALAFVDLPIALWIVPIPCFLMLAALVIKSKQFPELAALSSLGAFSYSLYLVHPVAIGLFAGLLRRSTGGLAFTAYVVFSLLLARAFYATVERRFITDRAAVNHPAAQRAVGRRAT